MKPAAFDPLEVPLDGLQLIEASAGTGKTFSLAGLFLRLLLERRLDVAQILVITFTHAATQELRARIRSRLVAAARIAAGVGNQDNGAENELAEAMIRRCEAEEDRQSIARRLRDAALRIDEAAISTIHGFAQRAVAEQAFDSGLPFDRGEQVDDASVFEEATADYWRGLAFAEARDALFISWWPTPEKLGDALKQLQLKPHTRLTGMSDVELSQARSQLDTLWHTDGPDFCTELRNFWNDRQLKAQPLKKALAQYPSIDEALSDLRTAIESEVRPPLLPEWVAHLEKPELQFMKKAIEAGASFLARPLPRLLRQLEGQPRRLALRLAHQRICELAAERKRIRRQFSFADMISALYEAVQQPRQGAALCRALHASWPWMLVDEFQDTDPQQYEILRRIHAAGDDGGLFMIGDPKQAIYGFRGGDVFAYLDAARDAGGQRFNLSHNYRSTASVIEATETLFRTPGNDAFLVDGIDYQTVQAGRNDHRELVIDGKTQAGLTFWQLQPDKPAKGPAERCCREATIAGIVRLLDRQNPAELLREQEEDDGQRKIRREAVQPGDIAVLVNTNRQAADMQRALARRGVASVCIQQQSVFATQEAQELLRVLLAADNPTDEPLIRGGLATHLLGYRLGQLIELQQSDADWHAEIERFQTALERWRRHGVLALLQPFIQAAAARLLGWEDGERRLSNYLQLAELLAAAEDKSFGTTGLLGWMRDAMTRAQDSQGVEAEQLRLESDAALVRIVTVHRAKGLEYPIVFLPFAPWLGGAGKPHKPPYNFHDTSRRARVEIEADAVAESASVTEARAEGIRQLYVALTRAEIACYLPWGAVTLAANSALASLLHRDDVAADSWTGNNHSAAPLNHANVATALEELARRGNGSITVSPLPATTAAALPPETQGSEYRPARTDLPAPARPWSVFSFTRILRASDPGTASGGAEDETAPAAPSAEDDDAILPDLPGGAGFGSAIHDLLEQALVENQLEQWRPRATATAQRQQQILAALRRHGLSLDENSDSGRNASHAAKIVEGAGDLVTRALFTPLPQLGCIADLPSANLRSELEFMFRLRGQRLSEFHQLLNEGGYALNLSREQGRLELRGLMHGFIDLVARHGDCYFVIDYKTNWLGPRASDYDSPGLTRAMADHHYDLQYIIYQIALHRVLAQRLPGYDPARDLGGIYYLFLRGMGTQASGKQTTGRGVYQDQPDIGLLLRLNALLDQSPESSA